MSEMNLPAEFANGYFLPPTIMANVPVDDKLVTEEIFGPITVVTKFSTEAEAIGLANNTKLSCKKSVSRMRYNSPDCYKKNAKKV